MTPRSDQIPTRLRAVSSVRLFMAAACVHFPFLFYCDALLSRLLPCRLENICMCLNIRCLIKNQRQLPMFIVLLSR
jgi:hypothetical protein